jgi:hypothetical protein
VQKLKIVGPLYKALVILSGVFCREGPMQLDGSADAAGTLHRPFAAKPAAQGDKVRKC